MCGICGVIGRTVSQSDLELVKKMNDIQSHRGPDDEGIYSGDNIVLGHRRLSILDLSPAGHQPMMYMDKYIICYNGEVYNYLELRKQLEEYGYRFNSNTDTEVIMASYDKWGVKCLEKFNGFWALALYDLETKKTILSRDRFGIKPLHFYKNNEYMIFSSEIKAILGDSRIKRESNDKVILDFLISGIVDFSDETFFKNIFRLPAGSYMTVDSDMRCEIIKFYDIHYSDRIDGRLTEDKINTFRELFDQSIQLRLRADVPVGNCLSGGLDSSSIVCHVNQELKNHNMGYQQETFSACYDNFKLDERKYIKKVIDYTGVKPNYVYPTLEGFNEEFDQLIYTQDEPFSTTSIYASYCVMREARRRNIPVLLDGQGADELLCGYRKSRVYYIRMLIKRGKIFKAAKEFLLSISQLKTSQSWKSELTKLRLILLKNNKANNEREFITTQFKDYPLQYSYNKTNNFQYNDMTKISVPSLLRYADRNSMRFSVEDRLPFLDYQFANFAAKLPLSMKLNNGYSKYIMRKALLMPEEIKKRKDKIGFATPDKQWLIQNSDLYYKLFSSADFRANRYIDKDKIIQRWDSIIQGKEHIELFRYICLEKWMRIFDVQ